MVFGQTLSAACSANRTGCDIQTSIERCFFTTTDLMMDETSKSRKNWGELEKSVLKGKGIDIGCGSDPVTPEARRFDIEHGDANVISQYVKEQFDFVFSSHCLEHMHNPRTTILDWWKLVAPGGHLF